MTELLSTTHLVDVALVVIIAEALVLVVLHRARGGPLPPRDILGQLLAGGLLLAAVRNAASGGSSLVTLTLLAASFPAHLYDLLRRVRAARS